MSRRSKILIFGLILVFSIYQKQTSKEVLSTRDAKKTNPIADTNFENNNSYDNTNTNKNSDNAIEYHPTPSNGFSPYDQYFGKGIYNNSSGNEFIIKNSNNTHAVVLLVNAYSGQKIRNEFIRKGSNFSMTGVPNGTYFLEWFSGNDWSPNYQIGKYLGGFQTDASFTKTREASDWMDVSGYQQWTVTLYSVTGGDVESETINANEFFN